MPEPAEPNPAVRRLPDPLPGVSVHAIDLGRVDLPAATGETPALVRSRRARHVLRELLSTATGRSPDSLRLGVGTHGKPFLEDPPGLEFNVTHTGELALVALAGRRAVGIDVERTDRAVRLGLLAPRVLAPEEGPGVAAASDPRVAFLRVWTLKEALLKARGDGIVHPLASIAVDPGPPPRLLRGLPGDPVAWRLAWVAVDDAHVAAVAVAP